MDKAGRSGGFAKGWLSTGKPLVNTSGMSTGKGEREDSVHRNDKGWTRDTSTRSHRF